MITLFWREKLKSARGLVLMGLLVGSGAQASGVVIQIHGENQVSQSNIELGSVAAITGAPPETTALYEHLILGAAPAFGETLTWTAQEISRRLRPYSAVINHATLHIPEEVRFVRAPETTAEKVIPLLRNAIKTVIPYPAWTYKITDLQIPEVLDSKDTISLTPFQALPRGDSPFELQVTREGLPVSKIKGTAHFSYFAESATIRVPIYARGKILSDSLLWSHKEVTDFTDIPASRTDILNAVAKMTLTPETILMRSQLDREMVLKFGEEADLVAQDEGFSVKTRGVAQQNGYIGDTVKMRALSSQKIINGIVVSKGVVRVEY